ncbi:hypothetical protein FNV43_RR00822 [Rhamnella rubrinervis]|uniref:Potassium channel n=1 Tax=Rhamnella rubrinervis TaxID=2594499 RepID=A0A8K0MRR1_9ROSA|nr:hypothetical protein FNV43_RR00822 [Rhamnella rubrinervis]
MKAEYLPPREDVAMQNEASDDVCISVSGEVEIIDCETEKELVVGTLQSGDMFGEVGALCYSPQSYTYRIRTMIFQFYDRLRVFRLFGWELRGPLMAENVSV